MSLLVHRQDQQLISTPILPFVIEESQDNQVTLNTHVHDIIKYMAFGDNSHQDNYW